MKEFDVVILTESRYLNPEKVNDYIQNILTEDRILQTELERFGLSVTRKDWADPDFDWSTTKGIVFRTTWDYFDRLNEFKDFLKKVEAQTHSINPIPLIEWNMDKWYLKDLDEKGVRVIKTLYLEKGEKRSLGQIVEESKWQDVILKPTVAATARHTYRINLDTVHEYESIFTELIGGEDMMLQPFQHNVIKKGEVSLVLIDGNFSHAVLKKARMGDFRVQDDFGGTLHEYMPSEEEIRFAEVVVQACNPLPAYARVDVMWDNEAKLVLSEVELIEPELWFRRNPDAAKKLAEVIAERFGKASHL